jgi:hypothetical protein
MSFERSDPYSALRFRSENQLGENMKEASASALRIALKAALGRMQNTSSLPKEGHWIYHRQANGGWSGTLVPKPSLVGLLQELNEFTPGVQKALEQDYPDYLRAVGTPLTVGALQPATILPLLAYEAHERFGTFAITDEQIEVLLKDVAASFDRDKVRFSLLAPALNLHGSQQTPPTTFPGGLVLRPMTDAEVTRLYGGNPIFHPRGTLLPFVQFALIKEIDLPKIVGTVGEITRSDILASFKEELDRCILAFAIFKDGGAVGYDGIRIIPTEFTLLGSAFAFGDVQYGTDHVPPGRYDLTPEEAPQLASCAQSCGDMHSTLEMAGHRLVDSLRRPKPRDAIVDAVIGLECILLANLGERTELRFRFSLRYASFFSKEERQEAFYTARDLYDLRSRIAHGQSPCAKEKIHGKMLTLAESATLARSALRKIIAFFMANSQAPAFMNDDYWVSRELMLNFESQPHDREDG